MSLHDDQLVFEPAAGRALRGHLRAPGDKSVSHRALLIAGLAEGRSRVRGLSDGEDVRHTREAVAALVAVVELSGREVVVEGGRDKLHEPEAVIDVGNSGTGIRLLAGVAAGLDGITVLQGDSSIARRPMDRVAVPLRAMGASVDGRRGGSLPPLVVRGGHLHGTEYRPPVPSAQVKSALLFAGLSAQGETTVVEEVGTRAHTEEMLAAAGAAISVSRQGTGATVRLAPGPLSPGEIEVPADPSQAAFWVVAACVTPGSELVLEDVYVGHGRAGFLEVLTRMGADIELSDEDPARRTANIRARYSQLEGTDVRGSEVPSLIDEIPVLAVAAAMAEGPTTFADAAELRVKETDRVETTVAMLRALGVAAEPAADGLTVVGGGGRPLAGGTTGSGGDHRIAMASAVAALVCSAPVTVRGWASTTTSYPAFAKDMQSCLC